MEMSLSSKQWGTQTVVSTTFIAQTSVLHVLRLTSITRELKHARFWDADGNRKWAVFPFKLPSHNHIHIAKYLFSIRNK